jgi:transcriptional regulator with XRE-family HTH domain
MEDLPIKFGKILFGLRTAKALSQEALAAECELDRNYISLLERGLRQPTLTTIFKIAKALNVSPSSIIKEVEKG